MNELYHYASPYYDPVKAHEYYMANRVLKGRRSTAGLNDAGKEAAKYVRDNLSAERKSLQERNNQARDRTISSETEKVKSQIAEHAKKTRFEIAKLAIQVKSSSLKDSPEKRYALKRQIESLREENNKQRTELQNQLRGTIESVRTNTKTDNENLANEYSTKYEAELAKMLADPEFIKTTKTTKSSSKSNTSKSSKSTTQPNTTSSSKSSTASAKKDTWKSGWTAKKQIAYEKRLRRLAHSTDYLENLGEYYVGALLDD